MATRIPSFPFPPPNPVHPRPVDVIFVPGPQPVPNEVLASPDYHALYARAAGGEARLLRHRHLTGVRMADPGASSPR